MSKKTYFATKPGISIWQPNKENPHEADKFLFPRKAAGTSLLDKYKSLKPVHPKSPLYELFIRAEQLAISENANLNADTDWGGIFAIPYEYHAGSKAIWHSDEGPYYGAFVFYLHEEWNTNWGGELLVRSPGKGCGYFIEPIPNRAVFIESGVYHMVTRVSETAKLPRSSIAGFYFKNSGIKTMAKIEGFESSTIKN